jgi:outer membrane protein assembly factor BamD
MPLLLSPPRLAAAVLLVMLAGCGNSKNEVYIEKPVDDLYNKAMDALVDERYSDAAKTFEQVESQHPYSVWATKSQLMGVYSLYEAGNYDQAVIAADRFIQLHPGHRDVAYAYYLKAICYYMQIVDVGRDQRTTELALRALDEIGRYYLKRGEYLAAINRFKRVIDNYQTTTHVPEALERLVECDLALGLAKEAKENASVLGYNYPGSRWYQEAYGLMTGSGAPAEARQGWFGQLVSSF